MSRHVSRREILRLTGLAGARTRFPWLLAGVPAPLMLPTRAPSAADKRCHPQDHRHDRITWLARAGSNRPNVGGEDRRQGGRRAVSTTRPEKEVLTLSTGTGGMT